MGCTKKNDFAGYMIINDKRYWHLCDFFETKLVPWGNGIYEKGLIGHRDYILIPGFTKHKSL
jgi:hypothetical protein